MIIRLPYYDVTIRLPYYDMTIQLPYFDMTSQLAYCDMTTNYLLEILNKKLRRLTNYDWHIQKAGFVICLGSCDKNVQFRLLQLRHAMPYPLYSSSKKESPVKQLFTKNGYFVEKLPNECS